MRALLPVATLYVGKLIIDEVVLLVAGAAGAPATCAQVVRRRRSIASAGCSRSNSRSRSLSDVLGRAVSLIDSLLSEQFSNETSLRLMEHAATLDLEDFEDSELQDRLERARRQAAGRMTLIGAAVRPGAGRGHDRQLRRGAVVYAPWLIALLAIALVPAFIGEAHFNAQSYTLNYARTPSGASSTTCARPARAWRRRRK